MRRAVILMCVMAAAAVCAPPALAGGGAPDRRPTLRDRVKDLQREIDSLTEDVDDLREPVAEFDLFDQCAYTIGVTQHGRWGGNTGFVYGRGGLGRRPALSLDIRGFGAPHYDFLAFPGEEPPSIECNEDAGEELIDN
jgi:outer membrane murein-binding lipoprotein Lpp